MTGTPDIRDLLAPFDLGAIERALLEAYRRGEAAGVAKGEALLRSRLESVLASGSEAGPTVAGSPGPAAQAEVELEQDGGPSRAPRGLTREVITLILSIQDAQTTQQVQDQAVAMDARLSAKTVYNELNRERGKLYRHSLGRWSLIPQQIPLVQNEEEENFA